MPDLSKLVSKKLTVTLATVGGLLAAKAYIEAAGVAVAYVTAQGVIDAKSARHILGTLDEVVDGVKARLDADSGQDVKVDVRAEGIRPYPFNPGDWANPGLRP